LGDVQIQASAAAPEKAVTHGSADSERISRLENELATLQNEVANLKQQFAAFRKQFE
jgi:molecular chaperone GrpE (heat shock protein)